MEQWMGSGLEDDKETLDMPGEARDRCGCHCRNRTEMWAGGTVVKRKARGPARESLKREKR